jgi:putative hydrolase of the HAD superfamily
VIFDLWDTLALWPSDDFETVKRAMSEHIDDFDNVWETKYPDRQVRPLADYFRTLGLDDETAAEVLRLRSGFTKAALVPHDGAIETLDELGRRGFKRGLISVCSSDVEELWDDTPFAPRLEAVVLSCAVGLSKPDPRIYELACERLGVAPEECYFVGDGANDELAGAARVGMQSVCIVPPGREEPLWPEARGWEPTIRSLPDVLELAQQVD